MEKLAMKIKNKTHRNDFLSDLDALRLAWNTMCHKRALELFKLKWLICFN